MNTRNFSLPQLQNLPIDEARIVADALAVHATSRQIDSAASKLAALAEAGLKGDRQAYAAYQQLLYVLSLSDDVATAQTRRWLARAIYLRIPRHLDTQPTIIWTLVPCSLGHL
ncbi:HOASN domain-containing protein, partial [Pseudomonas aeruginosa]|uniref:HOASN domain-containing protein n=1 Tax=Pseudomonas aeruginosa TaxID=287 RepID=UPI003525C2BF